MRCTQCGEVFTLAAGGTAAAAPSRGAGRPAARRRPRRVRPRRGRVLVATDGAEFLALIGEVLTAGGTRSRVARRGGGVGRIRLWRPHVALLDVALPGMPAFEFCDRVRAATSPAGPG